MIRKWREWRLVRIIRKIRWLEAAWEASERAGWNPKRKRRAGLLRRRTGREEYLRQGLTEKLQKLRFRGLLLRNLLGPQPSGPLKMRVLSGGKEAVEK